MRRIPTDYGRNVYIECIFLVYVMDNKYVENVLCSTFHLKHPN